MDPTATTNTLTPAQVLSRGLARATALQALVGAPPAAQAPITAPSPTGDTALDAVMQQKYQQDVAAQSAQSQALNQDTLTAESQLAQLVAQDFLSYAQSFTPTTSLSITGVWPVSAPAPATTTSGS